jgi:hypothetical protein
MACKPSITRLEVLRREGPAEAIVDLRTPKSQREGGAALLQLRRDIGATTAFDAVIALS